MKNKMKGLSVALCITFLIFVLCGCAKFTEKKEIKVMFVPKCNWSYFWNVATAGFNVAIAEYNVIGTVRAPENEEDYQTQISIINEAVKDGYHAIVLSAIDFHRLSECVKNAIDKGVSIVVVDSDVNVPEIKVRISTVNYQAGFRMGEQLASAMGQKANIGILMFDAESENGNERLKGFLDSVDKYNDMKIIKTQLTRSNHSDAEFYGGQMIIQNPDINAVVTFNELTTVGLGNAILKLKRQDLYAIGFDNNVTVLDYLENNIYDALIIQNQYAMGYLGAEYAIRLVNNDVPKAVKIDTGTHIVTRENMYNVDMQNILFPFDLE